MKKASTLVFVALLLYYLSASAIAQEVKTSEDKTSDTTAVYKDGTYTGMSRSKYVYEPYWGNVRFTLKNGLFTEISFVIRDSNLHETFDGNYEKHFVGNDEYIQQSRNDWKGVQTYPGKLSEKQNIINVDAVSGATWSYNIFMGSVKEALKKAR